MNALASALPALLSGLLLAPPDAETAVRGSFVTKLGDDIVAFESYTRTSARLEGDIVLRVPGTTRYHYDLSFTSDGSVKRSEFTIRPPGAPGVDDPRRLVLEFSSDSVRLTSIIRGEQQGGTRPRGAARHVVFLGGYGASHGLYGSFAMYEHLLLKVPPGPEPVRIEALGADSGKPTTRLFKRASANAAAVDYFKMAWTTLTLDDAGRILAGDATATTERTRTERVEFTDIDKVEKEFLALDRTGKGFGPASPNVEVKAKVDDASIVLKHGSPRLRGRTGIVKALLDTGTVWRTGANEATTLETNRDLLLGDTRIPAGKYSLWTQANAAGIHLIVNRETGQWGTAYKAAQDLVRVPLAVTASATPAEYFVIEVASKGAGHELRLRWDTFVWSVAIGEAKDDDEARVLAALHRACDAFRDGDVQHLEGFLAGFTLTDSSGKVTDREANLAEIRAREPRYEVFRNHAMTVRFYGETALVNGITSVKGVSAGQPFTADLQFTDTLILKDGVWRLVASHASRIAS